MRTLEAIKKLDFSTLSIKELEEVTNELNQIAERDRQETVRLRAEILRMRRKVYLIGLVVKRYETPILKPFGWCFSKRSLCSKDS